MPPRSKVYGLPKEVREALNERLVETGFSGYEELSAWLEDNGHQISRSAVHRYGQELEHEYESAMGDVRRATELARAYADADPDESLALTGSIAKIAQDSLLRAILHARKAEEEADYDPNKAVRHIAHASRALGDLGRLTISHAKHAASVRHEIEAEFTDRAERLAAREGISADAIAALRAALHEGA